MALRIDSWNVERLNADRASLVIAYCRDKQPDLLFLNETKCKPRSADTWFAPLADLYTWHINPCTRSQYHGTGVLIRKGLPASILDTELPGSDHEGHCREGRLITVQLAGQDLVAVGTYVPNSGVGKNPLRRLDYRIHEWNRDLYAYLNRMRETYGNVVWLGDLNVAPSASDIYDIKGKARQAGYTKEERESHATFLAEHGFIDAWRRLYPDEICYSYWTKNRWHDLRPSNRGWRLDHTIVNKELWSRVVDASIECEVDGSDHCPVSIIVTKSACEDEREESKEE